MCAEKFILVAFASWYDESTDTCWFSRRDKDATGKNPFFEFYRFLLPLGFPPSRIFGASELSCDLGVPAPDYGKAALVLPSESWVMEVPRRYITPACMVRGRALGVECGLYEIGESKKFVR